MVGTTGEDGEIGARAEAEAAGRVLRRGEDRDLPWTNRGGADAPRYATACAAWLAAALEDDVVDTDRGAFATRLMERAFPDGPCAIMRRGRDRGCMVPETADDLAAEAEARRLDMTVVRDRGEVVGYVVARDFSRIGDLGRHPTLQAAWLAAVARDGLARRAPLARRMALEALDAGETALTRGTLDAIPAALEAVAASAGVPPAGRAAAAARMMAALRA